VSGERVTKNSLILFITEAVRRVISFGVAVLIARALAVEDFGRFGVAMALAGIFGVIAGFGLNPLLTRMVASDPDKGGRSFGAVLGLKLVFGVLACLLLIGFSQVMGYEPATMTAVVLAALLLPAMAVEGGAIALFDGYQRMFYSAMVTLVKAITLLVGVGLVVWLRGGLNWVLLAYVGGGWLTALVAVALVAHVVKGATIRPDFSAWAPLVKQALPFFFIGLVWMVAFRVDTVMLERMAGEKIAGLYRSGYAFFEILLALPILATRALYPALSKGMASDGETWRDLLNGAMRVYLLIGLPIAVGCALVGGRFVPLFYGDKYAAGGQVVALLGGFLWIWFGTMSLGWALTAADHLRTVLFGNVLAMTVNIVANLLLIPRYQHIGAAWATVLSEVTLLTLFAVMVQRKLGGVSADAIPWRALLAAAALAAAVWPLREANLALPIIAGAAAYGVVAWISGAIGPREKSIIARMLRRGGS